MRSLSEADEYKHKTPNKSDRRNEFSSYRLGYTKGDTYFLTVISCERVGWLQVEPETVGKVATKFKRWH